MRIQLAATTGICPAKQSRPHAPSSEHLARHTKIWRMPVVTNARMLSSDQINDPGREGRDSNSISISQLCPGSSGMEMSEVNEQKDVEKQKNKVVEFRVTSLIDNIL